MNNKIHSFIEKNIPIGKNADSLITGLTTGLIICPLSSVLIFICKFASALQNLYYYDESGKRFISEQGYHNLHNFEGLINNCFFLFGFFFIILFVIAVQNYRYHFQESKSIYTMLRAGRNELIKRCTLIPLLTALFSLISMAVIYLFCVSAYILFLPDVHL